MFSVENREATLVGVLVDAATGVAVALDWLLQVCSNIGISISSMIFVLVTKQEGVEMLSLVVMVLVSSSCEERCSSGWSEVLTLSAYPGRRRASIQLPYVFRPC